MTLSFRRFRKSGKRQATVGALDKEGPPEGPDPGGLIPYPMRAVAVPMADPQLEIHWLPDAEFLILGFLIQGPAVRLVGLL